MKSEAETKHTREKEPSALPDVAGSRRIPMKIIFKHNRMVESDMVIVKGKLCRVIQWGRGECVAMVPEGFAENDQGEAQTPAE